MVPVGLQHIDRESALVLDGDEAGRRLADGDPGVLQALMDSHWMPLLQYAQGIVGDRHDGQDLVQEAFVRLWKTRMNRQALASPAAFLYRVVRNLALNQKRDALSRVRLVLGRFSGQNSPVPATPVEDCVAAELAAAARVAIRRLPDRRREIFELARFHGLSYQEIADVMGISPQTVANQMSRALVELRGSLAPYLANE